MAKKKRKQRVPAMRESTAWYIKHREHWTRLVKQRRAR